MAETAAKLETSIVTPECRISYPNLFKPRAAAAGQKEYYSVSLLFPKLAGTTPGTFLSVMESVPKEIKLAVYNAAVTRWGADKAKWPKGLRWPFRDGAEKEQEGYGPGIWFMNVKNENKPGIVDMHRQTIMDPSLVYGGCYGYASLNAFGYPAEGKQSMGNIGVSFGLNHFMLSRAGEPLGSTRTTPEQAFKAIAVPAGTPAGAAGAPAAGGIEDLF